MSCTSRRHTRRRPGSRRGLEGRACRGGAHYYASHGGQSRNHRWRHLDDAALCRGVIWSIVAIMRVDGDEEATRRRE